MEAEERAVWLPLSCLLTHIHPPSKHFTVPLFVPNHGFFFIIYFFVCVSSCYLYNFFIHLPVLQVSKHVRMEAGRTTGTGIPAHHCGWETGMNISCAFLWAVFELCLYLVTILICFCNYVKVTILHFCSETKYSSFLKVPYCTPFWSFIWGFDVLKNMFAV